MENTLTLIIAVIGAILGVFNTAYAVSRDRLKVVVVPKMARTHLSGKPVNILCIEVINKGTSSITISEVGFGLRHTKERMALVEPIFIDGKMLPYRLEARESFSAYTNENIFFEIGFNDIKNAYATTSCGKKFVGTSPALKDVVRKYRG
ncbi:hypothetical protein [Desulfolutivibrio sp.]|uniref:hypothetical protein n=1 Tax=Desulfolutivibrio sp. TaxID=2773296 RepID=UPI002F9667C6